MTIKAAIFDFDGTIVDSMFMWIDVFDKWFERYKLDLSEEVYKELEPLSVPAECEELHRRFGIGENGEALNRELDELLAHEYENTVAAWPTIPALIKDLSSHGVKLAIATSTDAHLVNLCLKKLGLASYFEGIVTTDDAGFDKSRPDVYLKTLELLGAELETTWVFEDAPFGLKSAHTAGFKCVCIYDPRSDRDIEELKANSELFSERGEGLSYDILAAYKGQE